MSSLALNFTPRLRALQYILQFLDDQGFDKTAAALRDEAYVPYLPDDISPHN